MFLRGRNLTFCQILLIGEKGQIIAWIHLSYNKFWIRPLYNSLNSIFRSVASIYLYWNHNIHDAFLFFLTAKSGGSRSTVDKLNEYCSMGAVALALCAPVNPVCDAAGAFCAGLATGRGLENTFLDNQNTNKQFVYNVLLCFTSRRNENHEGNAGRGISYRCIYRTAAEMDRLYYLRRYD